MSNSQSVSQCQWDVRAQGTNQRPANLRCIATRPGARVDSKNFESNLKFRNFFSLSLALLSSILGQLEDSVLKLFLINFPSNAQPLRADPRANW